MQWLFDHLGSLTPGSVYYTLAGILLLCGLGLPVPEDISLISAGYMAHRGVVNVNTVFLVCLCSVLAGDSLAFMFGTFFGARVLDNRYFQRFFTPRKQIRVRAYFRKYGSKVIFVGRFLPGLRFSIFFSAGTLGVRPATFLVYDTLAALLSVPALVYLAWLFGEHIDKVASWARRSEYGILVAAGAGVALVAVRAWRRRKRRRELLARAPHPAAPPPSVSPMANGVAHPEVRTPPAPPAAAAPPSGKPIG
jgi:membrane protein DedA with SNARE-associated domain